MPTLQQYVRNKKIIILIGLDNEALILQQLGLLNTIEKVYSFNIKELVRMDESRMVQLCPNLLFYYRSTNNAFTSRQSTHYAWRNESNCSDYLIEMYDIMVNQIGFSLVTEPTEDIDLYTNFLFKPFIGLEQRYELNNFNLDKLHVSFDLSKVSYKEFSYWQYKPLNAKYLPFVL